MARIRQVTDLRTGLIHPKRDHNGRFLSRKHAAKRTAYRARNLDGIERDPHTVDPSWHSVSPPTRHSEGFWHALNYASATFRNLVEFWNTQAVR